MILYSIGDSVVWGAELENKEKDRFSKIVANKINAIDCNNASAGVSNDYIFRNSMRDIHQWIKTKKIWSEETGWIENDKLKIIIGWTAPTRFEWWVGDKYQQERLWLEYDKWGNNDKHRKTEDLFILHQNDKIPSYIKTFNYIKSLEAICKVNNLDYYFFNAFYEYENIKEPKSKIDLWGRDTDQVGLEYLKNNMDNMYQYLKENGGTFLPRKHPSKESHKMWAEYIVNKWL
jgi:hypothetical protein